MKLVVARVLLGRKRGQGVWNVATRLGLNPRTVAQWLARWERNRLRIAAQGPKPAAVDEVTRASIETCLWLLGANTGVPTLEAAFPGIPRRQLAGIAASWRRRAIEGRTVITHALKWGTTGAVWAIDFTQPPRPVDGLFPSVLVVRDVASGYRLAARPMPSADASHVQDLLIELFAEHGPPYVLKFDNGSCFCNSTIENLLRQNGVISLVSPPGYPQYNGAIEAGIGSLKTFTGHLAAGRGHPGYWTSDVLEGARVLANALCRTWGRKSPTAAWSWSQRQDLTETNRKELKEMIEERDRTLETRIADPATRRRVAVSHSLQALKHLTIKRRRLSLVINPGIRRSVV
jgi:transposase InsO family protein